MAHPTWPLARCVVCSVLWALAGYGVGMWAMADLGAHVFGDYRVGLRGGFDLVPIGVALLGLIFPWVARARERQRENRRQGGEPSS